MSDRAGFFYRSVGESIVGAERLSIVFNHADFVFRGELHHRLHVAGLSEEMNDDYGLRLSRNGLFESFHIQVEAVGTHIDEDRRNA